MPVEMLRPSDGRLAMPFRILNKGPEYFRRPAPPGPAQRLSAVERLEADKAKYVKSQQVALTRQAPVIRKPLLSAAMLQQCHIATPPARKVPRRPADAENNNNGGRDLNLEVLNSLIHNAGSPSSPAGNQGGGLLSRRPPPVPARSPPYGSSPSALTVRRVDVRPHAEAPPPRPYAKPRQVAQPQAPLALPSPPAAMPPPSPAATRLSGASSRGSRAGKHPALHRSKSDLSDRYSRATADLERFFNYCGLDPAEVAGLGGPERLGRANSDIVSVSKMRSVSTLSSEGGAREGDEEGDEEEEEEREGPGRAGDQRVPYGISVIERNARVIKWLYGLRQARDTGHASSSV